MEKVPFNPHNKISLYDDLEDYRQIKCGYITTPDLFFPVSVEGEAWIPYHCEGSSQIEKSPKIKAPDRQ